MNPAERWAEQLAAWKIPDEILARAPEPPWQFTPSLFAAAGTPIGLLHREALRYLEGGGSVLDVGCGGGAASVPLVPPATHLIGVDSSGGMLESFSAAAAATGVGHDEILGHWTEVAGAVPVADVVVCRNVVYNVEAIEDFVRALSAHGRRRIVVELTDTHPSVPLRPLWKRFWNLDRPEGPAAELFVDVVRDLGYEPDVGSETRPAFKESVSRAQHVAMVRRRLCLAPSRDTEVEAALPRSAARHAVVVSWSSRTRGHRPT
ncbi:MAG TPA: methyltransferase domain-containing protein [Acidimicrobiales bacterium]|nr:methyltransferase domain-containing protein [Acidimicrobiales bacterium]